MTPAGVKKKNTIPYILAPVFIPYIFPQIVGVIEKWPPRQKNEIHTHIMYNGLFVTTSSIVNPITV